MSCMLVHRVRFFLCVGRPVALGHGGLRQPPLSGRHKPISALGQGPEKHGIDAGGEVEHVICKVPVVE
jgi:hypothetical protein